MNKYDKVNVKFLSLVSYIGPLFIIGKFSAEKNCDFFKFHVRQGKLLFFTMFILLSLNTTLYFSLSSISETFEIICLLFYIAIFVAWLVLSIMGIVSVFSESKSNLPLIDDLFNKRTKK